MKTAFEVVPSGNRIRPVAIVTPTCRSSCSSSSSSGGGSSSSSWNPVASSTTAENRSIVSPSAFLSRDPSTMSLRRPASPWTTRHISLQTNNADTSPFVVIDSIGRRLSDRVSSTKLTNRRKTKHRGGSGQTTSAVQRSSSLNNGYQSNSTPDDPTEGETVRSCNFYYVNLSNDAAKSLLHSASVGTFLLRDSSDRRFRYSLSVKTPRGTTSVRVAESESSGRFRLDGDPHQKSPMSSFTSILELIEHYCHLSNDGGGGGGGGHSVVLLESSGRSDTPMLLRRPLELSPAPLAHLCRRLVNRLVDGEENRKRLFDRTANVGTGIKEEAMRYLFKYPFRV